MSLTDEVNNLIEKNEIERKQQEAAEVLKKKIEQEKEYYHSFFSSMGCASGNLGYIYEPADKLSRFGMTSDHWDNVSHCGCLKLGIHSKKDYCINLNSQSELASLFDEAISLISKDKWQADNLSIHNELFDNTMDKELRERKALGNRKEVIDDWVFHEKQFGYGEYTGKYINKIKDRYGNVFVIIWGTTFVYNGKYNDKFLNSVQNQVRTELKDIVQQHMDNVKKYMFGSQRYVRKGKIILFDDGYFFPNDQYDNNHYSFSQIQKDLANMIVAVNNGI